MTYSRPIDAQDTDDQIKATRTGGDGMIGMTPVHPAAKVSPPSVSIVIPAYNTAATIERCIRSAMAQTLPNIEILVADDASTDATAALAETLCSEDSRVRLIRLPQNGGKSHAMNIMIDQARGDWVAVLDADDIFRPTRLAELLAAAATCDADLVADNLLYFDSGAGQVVRSGFSPFAGSRQLSTKDLLLNNDSFADFDYGLLKPIIRRSFLEQHSLRYHEDARLAEDFYYLLSFFVAGGRGCLVGAALYCWTQPFGSKSRAWTTTGAGAWRYNYRNALEANTHFITEMTAKGQLDVVAMLQVRAKQYRVMIHYLDAQRHASERRWLLAAATILCHPSTYRLLFTRIAGRAMRLITRDAATSDPAGAIVQ